MSKPYSVSRGRTGKYYSVDQTLVRYPCASLKGSKLSAGMSYTAARKGSKQGEMSRDALALAVLGTLDTLARGNLMKRYRHLNYKQVTRWVKK